MAGARGVNKQRRKPSFRRSSIWRVAQRHHHISSGMNGGMYSLCYRGMARGMAKNIWRNAA